MDLTGARSVTNEKFFSWGDSHEQHSRRPVDGEFRVSWLGRYRVCWTLFLFFSDGGRQKAQFVQVEVYVGVVPVIRAMPRVPLSYNRYRGWTGASDDWQRVGLNARLTAEKCR